MLRGSLCKAQYLELWAQSSHLSLSQTMLGTQHEDSDLTPLTPFVSRFTFKGTHTVGQHVLNLAKGVLLDCLTTGAVLGLGP